MAVPKPTLTAYSPGDSVGFVVTNSLYNIEVLQQGAWTQLMLGAATAFPASPTTADTCFRSDLGAWFRYDGAAWQQMGLAFFATANRPAAPPTNYRYADLTDGAIYRFNGTTYDGAWVAPTLLNSWVNQASGTIAVGYFKTASGDIRLRGSAKSGTLNLPAFTLPSGFRPAANLNFLAASNSAFGYYFILTTGDVTPSVGNTAAFSFDGGLFDTRS